MNQQETNGDGQGPLLRASEVAVILNCSANWVREHANRKRKPRPPLPSVKMGGLLRFRPQDIEDFIKAWCQ